MFGYCWGDRLPPTDRILPKGPVDPKKPVEDNKQYSCADKSDSLGTCLACCASRSPGQYSKKPGSICSQECYDKAGITENSKPKMCVAGE